MKFKLGFNKQKKDICAKCGQKLRFVKCRLSEWGVCGDLAREVENKREVTKILQDSRGVSWSSFWLVETVFSILKFYMNKSTL